MDGNTRSGGFRRGKGGVLWLATSPGKHGYERFPFHCPRILRLGFNPPFVGNRLWAFFDYAYRARVDVNWFAKRWHASGIVGFRLRHGISTMPTLSVTAT